MSLPSYTFEPPASLEAAAKRRNELIAEIQETEAQLGNKHSKKRRELGDVKWNEWRDKAKWAKTYRLQELRDIKQWIWEQKTGE